MVTSYPPSAAIPWYDDTEAIESTAYAIQEMNGGQPAHVTADDLRTACGGVDDDLIEWTIFAENVNQFSDIILERKWSAAELDQANRDFFDEFGFYPS